MKIITVALILCITVVVNAEEIQVPHVSVYGTSEIQVVPDEMHWSLEVKTKGNEVGQAAEAHDKKVEAVLKFLKERQIEDKKIQTSRIELSENWVHRGRDRVKEGYIASTQIVFESAKLDEYRVIWLGIANIPDVSVRGVSFDTSERIKYQGEARLKAVKVAREKAEALAKALSSSIQEPLLIEENSAMLPGMFNTRNTMAAAQGGGANGSSLAPGTISVTGRVRVKFRITSP